MLPAVLLAPGRMEEYNAQILTLSSAHPEFSTGLAFSHQLTASPGLLQHLLPVAARQLQVPAGDADVAIRLTLSSDACRAWNSAPKETAAAYFPTHAPVSVAIQQAIRRWLAWYWLSRIEHFADTSRAFTVLSYLASSPYPGRRRTDFTHDTMTPEWMEAAFRHSRRPLRALLRHIRFALIAAGQKELGEEYHPRQVKLILTRVRKERKSIRALVAAEGDLVNHILKFGLEIQGVEDVLPALHRVPEFMRGMGSRLRRLFNEQDLTWLGSVLLMEATNALWIAEGGASALKTSVHVQPLPPAPSPH